MMMVVARQCMLMCAAAVLGVLVLQSMVECSDLPPPLPYSETAVHGIAGAVYSTGIAEDVVANRRAIHRNPETKYEEYGTSELVARKLREMGIAEHNIRTGVAITGVIAHIGAGTLEESLSKHALNATAALKRTGSGPPSVSETARRLRGQGEYIPTVILRADMDALPIQEDVDLPFKSANDGVMHACGHDTHTAMLLGAAAVLKSKESLLESLGGSVRLMFQPSEEGGSGAYMMMKEGALDGGDAAVMLHANSALEVGKIASKVGITSAGNARIIIKVSGVGGHAASPHTANDVIVATSAIVVGVHGIISRVIAPTDAGVISLTSLRAGDAFNVLPNTAEIWGTIRGIDADVKELLISTTRLRAEKIAAAYGCTVTIDMLDGEQTNSRGEKWKLTPYPPGHNDYEMFEIAMSTIEELYGADAAVRSTEPPGLGSEDFSFLTNLMPSLALNIGHRSPEHVLGQRTGSNHHHPNFEVDERMLPRGAAFYASMAVKVLERFADGKAGSDAAGSSEL